MHIDPPHPSVFTNALLRKFVFSLPVHFLGYPYAEFFSWHVVILWLDCNYNLADRQPRSRGNRTDYQMVALLPKVWCFWRQKKCRAKKNDQWIQAPFFLYKARKDQAGGVRQRDGGVEFKRPRPPLAVSIDFM